MHINIASSNSHVEFRVKEKKTGLALMEIRLMMSLAQYLEVFSPCSELTDTN